MSQPPSPAPAFPPLWQQVPEPFRAAYDPAAPWNLLGDPLQGLLASLPEGEVAASFEAVHLLGPRISIGVGTRIAPGTVIEGPAWIGAHVEIRPGAYVRGGCWIGDGAIVGASTEVKASILFPGARAPHLNYVGDSILGSDVNLGAGTILSNFRHDGGSIALPSPSGGPPIATGRRKLGAVLGDAVATGCNSVLHPGVIVGRGSQIYPGAQLRSGIYPAGTLVKLRQSLELVELREA